MKKLISITFITVITAVAALLGSGAPLRAAEGTQENGKVERGQLSRKDYKFARDAAQGGALEVRLGELAKQKGSIQVVQEFGGQMHKDHAKANDELKQIIAKKGAVIPDELNRREESQFEHLQKLSGKEFDRAYAEQMVKDHRKDVKEFQAAAKNAEDPEIKAFAEKTLPILEHHTQMAEQMESSVKQLEP